VTTSLLHFDQIVFDVHVYTHTCARAHTHILFTQVSNFVRDCVNEKVHSIWIKSFLMCMYIHTRPHAHKHTHTYTHAHTHTHIYTDTQLHTLVYECVYIQIRTCMHVCFQLLAQHFCVRTCVCARVNMHTRVCV